MRGRGKKKRAPACDEDITVYTSWIGDQEAAVHSLHPFLDRTGVDGIARETRYKHRALFNSKWHGRVASRIAAKDGKRSAIAAHVFDGEVAAFAWLLEDEEA